ncbi:MAG: aromatic ring-hydroxylating dioxygenase subunit alpha [Opitutae bacterium]|nr:aromatic ring-hydroxylating dioxygenase subunit alpha [Opitutae bacterium]MBT6850755.1 aromatic ring-hydroxylating dioxygenase subunit alpha [Opitutae bacterium]MBT7743403.1 aromatic ring-hydroxylating dioxygenase subunit alpha [Opitutae bacterium]MBT7923088.1 aromatic ring-hydroxylating dioxygenase subunit alpha [Opitutae bacterium]
MKPSSRDENHPAVTTMRGHWYVACRSRQLRQRPFERVMLGEQLVLFRMRDGQVGALANRCAHRNLALSRGKVSADGLSCAYHGWTYDPSGTCVHVPAACNGCSPQARPRVRSYPVCEKQGLVWVYLSAKGEEPEGEPLDFPFHGQSRWQHWFMERVFEGDAFNCAENFLDCPHTNHVHKGLFRTENTRENEVEITSGQDWVQAEFLNEKRMDTLLGRILCPKGGKMRHTDRFILPYVTRVEYRTHETRHFVVMSQCTPIGDDQTRVFTYMAFRFDGWGPLLRLFYQPFAHRVLDQDVEVIRWQTEDIRRFGSRSFVFHESDAIAREMHALVSGRSLEGKESRRKKIRF